ncbi:hypothetical protein KG365_003577 [Salmonella enterica]|nr:hypothetical protein [Salmonella enterica subsp. enterica serovar Gatuni]EHM9266459.1 hypothetical protein [Salmonella enterica]
MSDKICINAQDLTEQETKEWLCKIGETAKELRTPSGVFHFQAMRLPSVAKELNEILDNTRRKINYLESVRTTYSADRPISVHEELEFLYKLEGLLEEAFQSVQTSFQMTSEILGRCWGEHPADEVPGFS